MKPTYIALDTETGGIGPEVSLLTAYFAVLDEEFGILDELSLAIKPDNDIYQVTAEALSINKIDLVKHHAQAISRSEAGSKFREFLIRLSSNGATKLVPVGHNVAFDLEKVYQQVLNKKEAQKYVSYRLLDTGSTGQFLKTAGLIPNTVSGSLGSYVEHFGVQKREAHDARNDVLMTVDVLRAQMALVKGR